MADIITRLKLETDEFDARSRRIATSFNEMSHQAEVAGNTIAVLNERNLALSRSFANVQTVSTTLKGKISELSDEYRAAAHHYNMLTDAEKRSEYGSNIAKGMAKRLQDIRAYNTELRNIEGTLSGVTGRGFGERFMQGIMPGFGMGAGVMGAMAAVKALNALKDVTKEAVRTNMEFEQSNANLAAVLGTTRSNISALTENAKMLGATTVYTAGQITELQTVLARRGFNEGQILQMTHGIGNLAVATGTDLAQAAELAGSTMQAFGMKASDMERIVSVLGVSTTKSALTTEKLGTAIQYVAPAASAAGYSLEEVVAMLGVLVDAGIDASTAGTALRQIMMSMSTENGKMAKSFGHPIRGMKDFIQALTNVKDAEDMLSDASQEVRVTAVPALIALAQNKDRIEELKEQITGVNDELQRMADEQLNTLQGSVTLMKSAWDGLMLTFSESNGPLKETLDILTGIINAWVKRRKLEQGGESALSVLRDEEYAEEAKELVSLRKGTGLENKVIIAGLENEISGIQLDIDEMKKAQSQGESYLKSLGNGRNDSAAEAMGRWNSDIEVNFGVKSLAQLRDLIVKREHDVGVKRAAIDLLTDSVAAAASDAGPGGGNDGGGGKPKKKKTEREKADERIEKAENDYKNALVVATEEFKQGAIDGKQFFSTKQSAQKAIEKAYADAWVLTGDEKYKKGMLEWLDKISETSANQSRLNDGLKEIADRVQNEKENNRELLRADGMLMGSLNSAVGRSAWQRINDSDGGALFGRLSSMKLQLSQGVEIPDEEWVKLVDDINKKLEELNLPTIKLDLETNNVVRMKNEVKDMSDAWDYASKIIGSVGDALGSIESPAAKIAGIIAGAIASMAAGLGSAIAQKGKELEPWSWIAFTAASTATFVSAAASVKNAMAEYHAEGGIAGSVFKPKGTDVVPAMLTPGEEILPASSPRHINNIGRYGGASSSPYVSGEMIYLGLNNYLRRTGRGEIVTAR